jgi:diguanylate cyclase (GGDEF)-like protein
VPPTPSENAPPHRTERAIRSRIVSLVLFAALLAVGTAGAGWAYHAHRLSREAADAADWLRLELAAAKLEGVSETARLEIERIARDAGLQRAARALAAARQPGKREGRAVAEALGRRLVASGRFDGGVVLDLRGSAVIPIGDGAEIGELFSALEPKSALDAELAVVMRGAELRKLLAAVDEPTVQALEIGSGRPVLLASAPIRDARGRSLATLHAHLRGERIAAALGRDASAPRSRIQLVDAQGVAIAPGGAGLEASGSSAGPLSGQLAALASGWNRRRALPIESLGWKVVVEEPGIRSLVPALVASGACLVLAGLLCGVLGGIALVRATRLARPLWALADGLKRAGEGEAVELVVPSSRGEGETLTRRFNTAVRRLFDERGELVRENRALRDQNDNFQTQHENLSKLTVTDALTCLPNRRYFEDQLSKEIKRLARHNEGLSMLVLDIDDFKKLNDQFGHAAGDEFLRQVARILRENVRATDLVARFGGEEFVIVATGTQLEGALVLAEKVRTAVAEASFIVDGTMRPRSATVSIGVACYRGSQIELFNSADAALYEAKAAGKNCVVAAPNS